MQGVGVGAVYLSEILVLGDGRGRWVCVGLDKVEVSQICDCIDDHSDNVSFCIQLLFVQTTKVLPRSLQACKRVCGDALVILLCLVSEVNGGCICQGEEEILSCLALEVGLSICGAAGGRTHHLEVCTPDVYRT